MQSNLLGLSDLSFCMQGEKVKQDMWARFSFSTETAMGADWPLDMVVNNNKCQLTGKTCKPTESCVCDIRTVNNEYICTGNGKRVQY